ncbi:MAG: branched-chain amino acid ABC transporter substrate-binding protein [Proteobacteria bacterium]|nr:branched-chain amino acid ABC transporter substrate-binding protein [Pseudomonadota bacterium]
MKTFQIVALKSKHAVFRSAKYLSIILLGLVFLGCEEKPAVKEPVEAAKESPTAVSKPQRTGFIPLKTDMSTFDPLKQTYPTSGDTIKIGVFEPFTGPSAISGEIYGATMGWVVHDINSQGGIMVDGKMKKIQIIKGDTQVKPATAKRVAEKLILEDEVDVLVGTSGTHINIIGQQVAAKYKKIYMTYGAYSDVLTSKKYYNRYTFRTCWTTTVIGRALAYYYSARPERKFYLLNQDYVYGHAMAKSFKEGLKKYRPEAEIVGETYHPLFTKDFAPYLEKVKGAQAEVIVSGNWATDEENLMKQSRQLGLKSPLSGGDIPLAGPFFDDTRPGEVIGGPAGRGIVTVFYHQSSFDSPDNNLFTDVWHAQWKNWKKNKKSPYDTNLYQWPSGVIGGTVIQYYWLFDVIRRAGSTDPEKIIATWEGDVYESIAGRLEMRACDHQAIRDVYVSNLDFPTKWQEKSAGYTQSFVVPARFAMPPIADDMKDRCK